MVGTLPPTKAISAYCYPLINSLCHKIDLDFVDFKRLYPSLLYRGKKLEDKTFKANYSCLFRQRKILTYYGPLSWAAAVRGAGRVVHIQFWSWPALPALLGVALLTKITRRKLVITVHNVLPHERDFLRFKIFHPLCRPFLSLADKLVCHSISNKRRLQSIFKFRKDKILVFPMGPLDFYKDWQLSKNPPLIKKEKEKKYLLYFGHIREYKGLDILLKAFGEICKMRDNLVLVIAGQPWESWKPFQSIIDNYNVADKVRIMSKFIPTNKVAAVFAGADLVVMPYKFFDGQSGAATLAVTFEKPLVVTNAGGLPDLVKDKRAVAKAGSAASLKRTILWALQNLQYLKKNSQEMRRSNSWEKVAQKTALLYRALLRADLTSYDKPQKGNLFSRLKFFLICFWHFSNWWEFSFSRKNFYPKILKLRSGIKLLLRTRIDYEVVWELIVRKVYLESTLNLNKNSVVVDIGAHEGIFSLSCARFSNKIYAFEPDPENFATFKNNLTLNPDLKINLYNFAIASGRGKRKFYSRPDRVSGGLISWFDPLKSGAKVISVDSVALENIFTIISERNIELLKIDCEGAEFEIFENLSAKYLKKIKTIAMEIHEAAGSVVSLEKKLVESGFKIISFFRPTPIEKIIVARRK